MPHQTQSEQFATEVKALLSPLLMGRSLYLNIECLSSGIENQSIIWQVIANWFHDVESSSQRFRRKSGFVGRPVLLSWVRHRRPTRRS